MFRYYPTPLVSLGLVGNHRRFVVDIVIVHSHGLCSDHECLIRLLRRDDKLKVACTWPTQTLVMEWRVSLSSCSLHSRVFVVGEAVEEVRNNLQHRLEETSLIARVSSKDAEALHLYLLLPLELGILPHLPCEIGLMPVIPW